MYLLNFSLEDIDWSGDNIKVMEHVTVTPPYKPENVRGVSDSKAVMHVRKIVSEGGNLLVWRVTFDQFLFKAIHLGP